MKFLTLRAVFIAAVTAMIVSFSVTANAHKVNIFAYAEGGKVHTESYFADGTRATDCRVTVEDMSGKKLLEGTTDKDGVFSFGIPVIEDLRIVLHASMGHQNDYVIKAAELGAAMPNQVSVKQGSGAGGPGSVKQQAKIDKQEPVKEQSVKPGTAEKAVSLSAGELRTVVDETVEARLKPLYGMLAEIKESSGKPSFTEVVGGIGYIMGIMGIILYFKSKKV